jgi:hypothetical protein
MYCTASCDFRNRNVFLFSATSSNNPNIMLPYSYEGVEREQLRLLKLEPGSVEDPIRISLTRVFLFENPEYEALSYCWGDPKRARTIFCSYGELGIASNLHKALLGLRFPDRPRTLWIDALCINQDNSEEKGLQILMMAKIYSHAKRVVIWLGEDSSDLEGLDTFIPKALKLLPKETYDNQALSDMTQEMLAEAVALEAKGQESYRHLQWEPFYRMLARPWFDRKWVIQEVAFAREAVVVCGKLAEISWIDLTAVAFRVSQFGILGMKTDHPEYAERTRRSHNTTMMLMMATYRGTATIMDAIVASQYFRCTEPRDHVFALLSLTNGMSKVQPDYAQTIEETFTAAAISSIVDEKSLNIFNILSSPVLILDPNKKPLELSLPSWVPNLTALHIEPLSSYTVRPRQFYAGGDGAPNVTVRPGNRVLECKGYLIDTVKAMAPCLLDLATAAPEWTDPPYEGMSVADSKGLKSIGDWLLACQALIGIDVCNDDTSIEAARAFCRALMSDLTGMRDRLTDDAVDGFLHCIRSFVRITSGESMNGIRDREKILKYDAQLRQSLSLAYVRKFCATEGGRFGQVPKVAEVGDRIVVFLGAEVCNVLRGTAKDSFTVVGDCYLSGVMDREVLSMEEYRQEDIVLE